MNKRSVLVSVCVLVMVGLLNLAAFAEERHSVKPALGFVPDQHTAIRIAEAVLIPIYGNDAIIRERPFSAQLERDVWIVEGQLPQGMLLGGVAMVEISKADGRILRVSHGR